MESSRKADIIVIGAGLSGLTAASELHQKGIDVMLLEASSRVGGRVYSTTSKLGSNLDLGGHWIGHDHHHLTALIEKAGGTIYKTFTRGLPKIVHAKRVIPIYSPSALLSLLYLAFIEILVKIHIPKRWAHVTVDTAINSCVPLETARLLLSILATVTTTADLKQFSMYSLGKMMSLSGGLMTMMETNGGAQDSLVTESIGVSTSMLERQLSGRILSDMVVSNISQDRNTIIVKVASGQTFTASKAIITIPPPMLKSVTFEPALPAERIALQDNLQMGIVYKAIAVFEKPFWRDGFGGEIIVLDDPACGVFDTSPPGGPGHLCFLVTGTPARQLDSLEADDRRDLLLSRLEPYLGHQVLKPADWLEKSWQTDEFCGGGYMAFPLAGTPACQLPLPHEPIGNLHWAGTETAQEHPGYIEGAIQSGMRAASEVVENLCSTI